MQQNELPLQFLLPFSQGHLIPEPVNTHTFTNTHPFTHTYCKGTDVKPHSQGKQLGHVTEAVVGQRADLVVTHITEKETITDT